MGKVILIFFILFLSVQKTSATTTIRMLPSVIHTQLDGTFTISVVVENVTDLMAGKIELYYDKTKINAETIIEGETFLEKNGGNAWFFTKKIDNNNGSINVEFAIFGGTPTGVSGTGTIFSVAFKTITGTPTSQIIFNIVDLRNTASLYIPIPPGNQFSAQVSPIPFLHHYRLTTSIFPIIAGIPFDLILSAKDINNEIVTTYEGTATLSVDKGTITPTQTSKFVKGVATVSLTFYQAGTITITARDLEAPAKLGTISLIVIPGTLSKVVIIPEQIPPIPPVTPFQFEAKAYDKFQNEIFGCIFSWEVIAGGGTISPTGLFIAGTQAGVYPKTIKVMTSQDNVICEGYASVTITSGVLHHFVFDHIYDQEAGRKFYITITAKDIYGNTVTTYTGANSLEDTTFSINPTTTSNFIDGVLKDFPVTITRAQKDIQITTQGALKTGVSNLFTVSPASDLDHFKFTFIGRQHTNVPFTINIKAEDRFNNHHPYSGTASLTDTTGTIQPTEIKFNNGVWNGQVTLPYQLGDPEVKITVHGAGKIGTSNIFPLLIDHTKNTIITHLQNSTLHIPPNAISEDYYLRTISNPTGPEINNANFKDDKDKAFDRIEYSCCEYQGFNEKKIPITENFKVPVILIINYDDTDQDGKVDGTIVDEMSLKGCELKNQSWVDIENSVVDNIGNKVTVTIPKFGVYILKGATIISVNKFIINHIDNQRVNEPFRIQVIAQDEFGRVVTHFKGTATLSDTTKTIFPRIIGPFINGIGYGSVTIKKGGLAIQITVQKDNTVGISNPFDVLLPKDKGHYQKGDGVTVKIDSHSLPEDYILEIDQFSDQDNLDILLANEKFNRDPIIQQVDKSVHKFTLRNSMRILELNKGAQITITFSYTDTDLGQIDETKLKVYRLDSKKQKWIEIPSFTIYPFVNKVTATISQMGIYTLAGPSIASNLDGVVVFPNPFRIDRDGSIIEFVGLPKDVSIRIYDISGNLVKHVTHQTATWQWNVTKEVDSGIYIYVITDKEGRKIIGKIGIIR